ncbi:hypothetical protein ACTUVN_004489 [Pseudomonas caspiana]
MDIQDVKVAIAILLGLMSLLFSIAKATPSEKGAVINWMKTGSFAAFLLAVVGGCIYQIQIFAAAEGPASRSDIFSFAWSVVILVWYLSLLGDYLNTLSSKGRKQQIAELSKELDEVKIKLIKNLAVAEVFERLNQSYSTSKEPTSEGDELKSKK